MKTFIREIPIERLTDDVLKQYNDEAYEIKWMAESVEVWYIQTLLEKAA